MACGVLDKIGQCGRNHAVNEDGVAFTVRARDMGYKRLERLPGAEFSQSGGSRALRRVGNALFQLQKLGALGSGGAALHVNWSPASSFSLLPQYDQNPQTGEATNPLLPPPRQAAQSPLRH
jgi:hypothetical protein